MKVAIVNDMGMAREILSRVVSSTPGCELAWTASSGDEAVERCAASKPDLLIMDIFMPGIDGVEATRRVMASSPCQILVVTASLDTKSSKVFEALGAGAMDAIRTPSVGPDGSLDGECELRRKLSQFVQLANAAKPEKARSSEKTARKETGEAAPLLALIGASTGGPNALAELLAEIPASANVAIVVVQHLDRQFAQGLASWLDSLCAIDVAIVKPGDKPRRGAALIAATNDHLTMLCDGSLQYVKEPLDNPFRPSVDVFFGSVACRCVQKGVAALLTGIGRDGASGLLALKTAGWRSFAQSKESCVVYGMPKAAAELGAADEILSPKEIGKRIVALRPGCSKGL